MSKKIYQTVLDPSRKVSGISFSSENPNGIAYDEDGKQIPYIEQLVDYKPQYDQEIRGKRWSFNFKFEIYVDIHKKLVSFWFPSYWLGQLLISLPIIIVDKFFRTRF